MDFTGIKKQYVLYKKEIDQAVYQVLESGHFILGKPVEEIEESLACFVGVKECITVSSASDALLIALRASEIGPGDEVITTPFTWISPAEEIKVVGATPVYVDIDPDTYCLDPHQIESAITPRTRAIIAVSLFGQMPDYRLINEIAKRYGLIVIEDGAQSFGATQHGRYSCGVTTIGVTSFFPSKPFGCYGDGGAIFTSDLALAEKMRSIRVHGAKKRYEHDVVGMNGRFDTLQAAILLAKFPHFPSEIQARVEVGSRYTELLKGVCDTPEVIPGNTHLFALYTIRVPDRDQLAEILRQKGIPTGIYYPKCVPEQPAYRDDRFALPVAKEVSQQVISLPMHPWLSLAEQERVVEVVRSAVGTDVPLAAQLG